MDSGERGMNPVAMTILKRNISLNKDSNHQTPVLMSSMLLNELQGLSNRCVKGKKSKSKYQTCRYKK